MTELTQADLVPFQGEEPRIADLVLAERLGFAESKAIRRLIKRNTVDLERYGTLGHGDPKSSGGRPGVDYYLNEGQALRLCTLSRTDRAAEITHQVITIYQAWRRGQTPKRMSPDQVLEMMREAVAREVPTIVEAVLDRLTPAVGGAVKGIISKQTAEMKVQLETKIEELTGSHDGRRNWAIDFKSMRRVLNDEGIPTKKRRGLSTQCSNRCVKWAKKVERDREWKYAAGGEDEKKIFHVDLIRDWLAAEGKTIIRAHQDRVAGQTVMQLVPKGKTPNV